MAVNGRPVKRLRRCRVTAALPDFLFFPPCKPFRFCPTDFLSAHATLLQPPHLSAWLASLRFGDPSFVCLYVVEEDLSASPPSPYCDHCRVVGWSGHPVCRKLYHFIIKSDSAYEPVHPSDSRSFIRSVTQDVVQNYWSYQDLEDTTHLLHGIVHSNGFGHLLRVNGREGGSRVLSGHQIMGFWDRLCSMLGVRKVSVIDVSKKYGFEYCLLHAIIKGHPWYGEWGYKFGMGSFGLSRDDYDRAVQILSSLPLSSFDSQEGESTTHLESIISFYKSLSKQELVCVRDLFTLLMHLIHEHHKSFSKPRVNDFQERGLFEDGTLHPWNGNNVEKVKASMIKVLRAVSRSNWVSSRDLRGAVCRMPSPELLDYCLEGLEGGCTADGMVVSSRCSPQSGSIEYRLEPGIGELNLAASCNQYPLSLGPSEENLMRDLRYIYLSILRSHAVSTVVPSYVVEDAARKIIDCKHFVKDYRPEESIQSNTSSLVMLVSCEVELVDQSLPISSRIPPEMVMLSSTASVSDLKHQASMAFQDVYLTCRRFQAEEVMDFGSVDYSTRVGTLQGSTRSIRLRGRCFLGNGMDEFATERGLEDWTMDCRCGANDDDGERMLACDTCGVWRHTRCSGIHDLEPVPERFDCQSCSFHGKSK